MRGVRLQPDRSQYVVSGFSHNAFRKFIRHKSARNMRFAEQPVFWRCLTTEFPKGIPSKDLGYILTKTAFAGHLVLQQRTHRLDLRVQLERIVAHFAAPA